MFEIKGLDNLTRQLEEAQKAFAELDGEIGTVNFDPSDPASIESAIKHMESMIDDRLGPYASNAIIGPMIEKLKERYRKGIVDKAAEARMSGDGA